MNTNNLSKEDKGNAGLPLVKNSPYRKVTVNYAPISSRYWNRDDIGYIDDDRIRLSGCWFPYDGRYVVEDCS